MSIRDNIKSNPAGLNVVIGLLLLSILLSVFGMFKHAFISFSLLSIALTAGLMIGLLLRKKWARILTVIIACLLLMTSLPLVFFAFRNPTKALLIPFGQFSLSLYVLITFWSSKIRNVFSGGLPPKPASAKRIFYTTVLPVLLILTAAAAGGYFMLRRIGKSFRQELPGGNLATMNPREMKAIGRTLLEGKFLPHISKVVFVSHPVEFDGKTGAKGIVNPWGNIFQMPQYTLPLSEGTRLLEEMASLARNLDILLDKESREKQKITGEKWYRIAEKYPDYEKWLEFHHCGQNNKGLDGSLIVTLKNQKAGRIYLRECGKAPELYFWVGDDSPVPMVQPIAGTMAVPGLITRALSQVKIPPGEALYPELSSEEANKLAAEKIGQTHQDALDYLHRSGVLRKYLGPVKDIRPAAGENRVSHWLDLSANLTYLAEGSKGKALVTVNQNDYGITGRLFYENKPIGLERAYRRAPKIAEEYIQVSILLALEIGKLTSVQPSPNNNCRPFYIECQFDVEGENGKGVVLVDLRNPIMGILQTAKGSIPLETRHEGQRWGAPASEFDLEKDLIVYAIGRQVSYSHAKQKNLKETAFSYSVVGHVQNISDQIQSFFVESRNAHRHWKGKTSDVKTALWPYKKNTGIVRVDLKPGEIYTMEFPLVLSPKIKPRLRPGSIAHAPHMFRLEFTPLYSRMKAGKTEKVENLGTFSTPEFFVIVKQ